jgi:hypothetical protein
MEPKGTEDDALNIHSQIRGKTQGGGRKVAQHVGSTILILRVIRLSRNGTVESFERCIRLKAAYIRFGFGSRTILNAVLSY